MLTKANSENEQAMIKHEVATRKLLKAFLASFIFPNSSYTKKIHNSAH